MISPSDDPTGWRTETTAADDPARLLPKPRRAQADCQADPCALALPWQQSHRRK